MRSVGDVRIDLWRSSALSGKAWMIVIAGETGLPDLFKLAICPE